MVESKKYNLATLGVCIFLGLAVLGYLLSDAVINFKLYERSVTVKGLSEQEFNADIVIWPIQFTVTSNDVTTLYTELESQAGMLREYLLNNGINGSEISVATPAITDKSAQQYGGNSRAEFRFTAAQIVTVYSSNIDQVRAVMSSLSQLGKQGIVFSGGDYQTQTEYLFTRLNEVKPQMIEDATTKAREVAEKFARDSKSSLGKIKRASQGQFSIGDRDKNNPHIKRVRVVTTVEYFLTD